MAATTQLISGTFAGLGRGVILPFTQGLVYANYYGVDAEISRRNLVPGLPAGLIVGAPTYTEGTFQGSNTAFEELMSVSETSAMTIAAACRAIPGAAQFHFPATNIGSTAATTTSHGFGIRMDRTNGRTEVIVGAKSPTDVISNLGTTGFADTITDWGFRVASIDGTLDTRRIRNLTTGASASGSATTSTRQINAERTFRAARGYQAGENGAVDLATLFIANFNLTEELLQLLYAQAKKRLGRLSTPIAI
jgi:hypothetical protein